MKQLLVVAVMILVAASFVMGQTLGMATSKHNFAASSANTIKGASEKVCAYCHTPHVPATGIKAPLWSRKALLSTGYGVYSSATMDAAPTALAAGQDNVSSMCMSCHDGSALFASAAYEKRPYVSGGTWDELVTVGNSANLHGGTRYGTGLSHTHPVNFAYDAALVTADGALQGTPLNNLPLYNGMMQCGSCHNPHLTSKMTRVTSDGGVLCISCHIK
jgi:predicted CXXCH cytochrome family protein